MARPRHPLPRCAAGAGRRRGQFMSTRRRPVPTPRRPGVLSGRGLPVVPTRPSGKRGREEA